METTAAKERPRHGSGRAAADEVTEGTAGDECDDGGRHEDEERSSNRAAAGEDGEAAAAGDEGSDVAGHALETRSIWDTDEELGHARSQSLANRR